MLTVRSTTWDFLGDEDSNHGLLDYTM